MVASIRPRLELVVHLSVEQVMRSVRLRLKSPDCPVSGLVAEHRLEVHAHAKDQHLWSPQLIVDLEPLGDVTRLHGRFGPHPSVWTMYVAGYAFVAFTILIGLSFGVAQSTLGATPWALLCVPAGAAMALGLYLLAVVGQNLSETQIEELRAFIADTLDVKRPG